MPTVPIRKAAVLAAAFGQVVALSACAPPTSDWFDNGAHEPAAEPSACAVSEVPAPVPFDPFGHGRPNVPEGWLWQVITLDVRALSTVPHDRDWCVPMAIHVYASGPDGAALAMVDSLGQVRSLPYDSTVSTPWVGAYLVPAYDPTSPRFRDGAPQYSITLQATYLRERDMAHEVAPAAMRCAIGVSGVPVATDLAVAPAAFASCKLADNTYRP